jgi:23S rRNA pseudouridine2604 synthase
MNINQFIINKCAVSFRASVAYIQQGVVLINGIPAIQKQDILPSDTILYHEKVLQEGYTLQYIAFYKPRGIECTLNAEIADNLLTVLPFNEHLFPIGRLDKASEGLLLLTNDGSIYNKLAHADARKEKEYLVSVGLPLTNEALLLLSEGVSILGQMTRPCIVKQVDAYSFRIVLTQGLNRQIRRMCYKLGYQVLFLKRLRIAQISLGNLQPGEYIFLKKENLVVE